MTRLAELLNNISSVSRIHPIQGNAESTSYTSMQLLQKWLAVQRELEAVFVDHQHRIGVIVRNKLDSVICMGGILLSRHIYVPLDYTAPLKRNLLIISSSALHGVLVDKEDYHSIKELLPLHKTILCNVYYLIIFSKVKLLEHSPDDLVYILHTSGSTGIPKGVMLSSENIMSFIQWASSTFDIGPTDKIGSLAPFHFDLSLFDIFMTMKQGAGLHLFSDSETRNPRLMSQIIAELGITVLYTTPTTLRYLLHYGKLERYDFSALRYVLFAGEVFPIDDLKALKSLWDGAIFYNLYGPTETNVCTAYKLPQDLSSHSRPIPIGHACIPETTKISSKGELLISGPSLTPGYVNNPQLNKSLFFTDASGKRWYNTGDIVECDVDGRYLFVGRLDRMIKRRGYRIELDEIEHVIRSFPEIRECAVDVQLIDENHKIICYYNFASSYNGLQSDLRASLLGHLPAYMLPDHFYLLNPLPKTSTHKIDYQSLKKLYERT